MPLTKRQFELGVDQEIENLMRLIYRLLGADRDLAYSKKELWEKLGMKPEWGGIMFREHIMLRDKFVQAVNTLVEITAVEARDVAGDTYYAFEREVDENTWEAPGGAVARYPSFS